MHYVQESLAPGEKILKISQYHWIYVFRAALGATFFFAIAFAILFLAILYHYYDVFKLPPWKIPEAASELAFTNYVQAFWRTNILVRVVAFLMVLMGLIQIGAAMLVVGTTEIAVTSKRVVLKRGLVSRIVEQMRTDFIEGDDVVQGVLGRIFDYGQVKIYGTGTESIFLPKYTTDPIGFRRAIQIARTLSVQGAEHSMQAKAAPAAVPLTVSPAPPTMEPR